MPSLPFVNSPQAYTSPYSETAIVWYAPHETCLNFIFSEIFAKNWRGMQGTQTFLSERCDGFVMYDSS